MSYILADAAREVVAALKESFDKVSRDTLCFPVGAVSRKSVHKLLCRGIRRNHDCGISAGQMLQRVVIAPDDRHGAREECLVTCFCKIVRGQCVFQRKGEGMLSHQECLGPVSVAL